MSSILGTTQLPFSENANSVSFLSDTKSVLGKRRADFKNVSDLGPTQLPVTDGAFSIPFGKTPSNLSSSQIPLSAINLQNISSRRSHNTSAQVCYLDGTSCTETKRRLRPGNVVFYDMHTKKLENWRNVNAILFHDECKEAKTASDVMARFRYIGTVASVRNRPHRGLALVSVNVEGSVLNPEQLIPNMWYMSCSEVGSGSSLYLRVVKRLKGSKKESFVQQYQEATVSSVWHWCVEPCVSNTRTGLRFNDFNGVNWYGASLKIGMVASSTGRSRQNYERYRFTVRNYLLDHTSGSAKLFERIPPIHHTVLTCCRPTSVDPNVM